MKDDALFPSDSLALEKAAKYICNMKDGLCPMVVENMQCRSVCTVETLPWQCWVLLFREAGAGNGHEPDKIE